MIRHSWTKVRLWLLCWLAVLPLWAASSVWASPTPSISTGKVYSAAELRVVFPTAHFLDDYYAEVNEPWLKANYRTFRHTLFNLGVVGWDPHFDCNHFAGFFVEVANAQFATQTFHTDSLDKSLALFQFCYVTRNGERHCIVAAFTQRGLVYLEPQTGEELNLTPAEKRSVYLVLF